MSEQAFLQAAQQTLDAIESSLERIVDTAGIDIDLERQGNVLTLTFEDDAQIVINSHSAAQEIWVAARSGGFHYRLRDARWIDSRNGDELFAALSLLISAQSGATVRLSGSA